MQDKTKHYMCVDPVVFKVGRQTNTIGTHNKLGSERLAEAQSTARTLVLKAEAHEVGATCLKSQQISVSMQPIRSRGCVPPMWAAPSLASCTSPQKLRTLTHEVSAEVQVQPHELPKRWSAGECVLICQEIGRQTQAHIDDTVTFSHNVYCKSKAKKNPHERRKSYRLCNWNWAQLHLKSQPFYSTPQKHWVQKRRIYWI